MVKITFFVLSFFIESLMVLPGESSYWLKIKGDKTTGNDHFKELTLKDFEWLAKEVDYLNVGSLLYHRSENGRPVEPLQTLSRFASVELLEKVIAHKNPRVRTLGLYAIHEKEQPNLLPLVFSALQDSETTFPWEVYWSHIPFGDMKKSIERLKKQTIKVRVEDSTVGQHAGAIIQFWQDTGIDPFNYQGIANQDFINDWKAFWELRKDCDHCVAWVKARFKRASSGTSQRSRYGQTKIEHLKYSVIWKMPSPQRQLILLRLATEWRQHPDEFPREELRHLSMLASDFDLREACQQLGPEYLMKILRFEPLTDDPDLQPDSEGYQHIVRWILMNVIDILPSSAAPELVKLGREQEGRFNSPWWFIAAAQLDPAKAREYLDTAWPLFQGEYQKDERAWLMWARWKVLGMRESDVIAKWFYNDLKKSEEMVFGHRRFLNMLRGTDVLTLLAQLATEKGFLGFNDYDLSHYVLAVSRHTLNPPIDCQDYFDLGKPGHLSVEEAQKAIRTWAKKVLTSEATPDV